MQRELCAYLRDIERAVNDIPYLHAALHHRAVRVEPSSMFFAVERSYEIIGEALRQAGKLYPGTLQNIPAIREVIDQRNDIAHRYFDIDAAILWSAAQSELMPFLIAVERLISLHCAAETASLAIDLSLLNAA